MSTPRSRLAGDRGSLPVALLLAVVCLVLTVLLTPMVLAQLSTTRSQVERNQALNAAQAGLDVGMAQIRAAADASGRGVLAELPCGPLSGGVTAGGPRYQVTIRYLSTDPRAAGPTSPPDIPCDTPGGPRGWPSFAELVATGDNQASGTFVARRTLRATYRFRTTNENTAGGLIHLYQSNPDMCLDAGSASPAVGTQLVVRPCDPQSDAQVFEYTEDLNLVHVASGVCVDAAPLSGNPVTFQPCATPATARQRWSLNDNSNFQGTTDGFFLNSLCFRLPTPVASGSAVTLGACGARFAPEASVGAGAARKSSSETSLQLVNFSQFGRCLDVTEFWNWTTYGYLISWPCKQAPSVTQVGQNQRWELPAIEPETRQGEGPISTLVRDPNTVPWCLQSPGMAAGGYVRIVLCPTGPTLPVELTWTVYGDTGVYATSYQIADWNGYCLAPTDQNATPPDLYPQGNRISKIVVRPCDGTTLQKWNASSEDLDSMPLKDIGEQ